MFGNARINELRLLWREAASSEGSSQATSALCAAFPGLIDEITQLRNENERLRDTLGEVRQVLEAPYRALGARRMSPAGLL